MLFWELLRATGEIGGVFHMGGYGRHGVNGFKRQQCLSGHYCNLSIKRNCATPENVYTSPTEGIGIF